MQTITKEKISFGVTPNNCNRTSQKKISGFQEWASKSINIVTGCSNDCKYCYARAIFSRFKKSKGQEWKEEDIRTEAVEKGYRKYKGKVGFPSTHDITPNNLDACLIVLKKLLAAGNDVLIVSKPNFECIKRLCDELSDYMDQILWRFTISTLIDKGFVLYDILVEVGQVVNYSTPLAKIADISKAKLTIYLDEIDVRDAKNRVVYIDGKKTSYKISRALNIADSKNISKYMAQIIIKSPKIFSKLVTIELKDQ